MRSRAESSLRCAPRSSTQSARPCAARTPSMTTANSNRNRPASLRRRSPNHQLRIPLNIFLPPPARLFAGVEGVGDGIAAVAAEVAASELDAGRRLAALIFGAQQLLLD